MRRVVIVGQGPAGHRLAQDLYRRVPDAEVTVLGAENRGGYNRVLLSSVLTGSLPAEAINLPPLPDAVAVHAGVRVAAIDRSQRRVHTEAGTTFHYDDLVLATGAQPRLPAVAGLRNSDGVLAEGLIALRTLDDCERIAARLPEGARAVVLGGGLLGVETARALAGRGVDVRIVEQAGHLIPRQLNAGAGEILAGMIERLSIKPHVGADVVGYRPGAVELVGGETLPADAVIVTAGARPETRLAEAAGLAVTADGVLVDDELRTSDPHIRAIGDCVWHPAGVPGRLEPAWAQADVLAELLSGSPARYQGSKDITRLRARDIDLATIGAGQLGEDEAEVVLLSDPTSGKYARFAFRDGALAGAILLGCPDATGLVTQCYDRGSPLPADLTTLLLDGCQAPRELSPAQLPEDSLICLCNNVSKKAIVTSWQDGARTATAICHATRAATGCGGCANAIEGLCSWLASSAGAGNEAA